MNSDNGETIPLEHPVNCIGGVEVSIFESLKLLPNLKAFTYTFGITKHKLCF